MIVHIPRFIVQRAISYAQMEKDKEAVGFFAINPGKIHGEATHRIGGVFSGDPYVEYKSFRNYSPRPTVESEVSAEDMAVMIVEHQLQPIAIFHSHPSGNKCPSRGDLEYFPKMYVDWGFIWTQESPGLLTQYSHDGAFTDVPIDQVFIEVQG